MEQETKFRISDSPVIYIDPQSAHVLDREIALQKIYYRPEGYYRTAEKMRDACKKPKFIQYASFNGIQDLNEVHKSDLTPLSFDKIGNRIFKHRGVIKDVATRFRKSCALTNKSSASLAKMFKAIYGDPNNHLTWPKVLIVDKGSEYLGECRDLLLSHGVKIIQAKSKRSTSIAERDHQEFEKHAYIRQDAVDFHLPLTLTERCRSWVKGLRINDDIYNDTPTRFIHMSPNEAVKRALKGEKIIADPSVKHRRPIGFNEPRLSYKNSSDKENKEPGMGIQKKRKNGILSQSSGPSEKDNVPNYIDLTELADNPRVQNSINLKICQL
ncbi:8293_t:CDS:2 [Ambispora gerdemannii]|uniref:8293_t:CDS:1 n=1 Tax=Ambispora gerdemannii TaxID=144530 RepID=A0A9N8WBC5_9GLOM|nr:8293_t:CDS:2 [Ambispora gerdemannii]